jgi:hypothetical protein
MRGGDPLGDINASQVMQLLIDACPSFAGSPGHREWTEEWADEEDPLLYLLASAFVCHLASLNAAARREEFQAVFALVEELHLRGDEYVCELTTVGFIEDLQNTNLHCDGSRPRTSSPTSDRFPRGGGRRWICSGAATSGSSGVRAAAPPEYG